MRLSIEFIFPTALKTKENVRFWLFDFGFHKRYWNVTFLGFYTKIEWVQPRCLELKLGFIDSRG